MRVKLKIKTSITHLMDFRFLFVNALPGAPAPSSRFARNKNIKLGRGTQAINSLHATLVNDD